MAQEEKKELSAQYRAIFGKNPAPVWSAETIREKIEQGVEKPNQVKKEDSDRMFKGIYIDPKKSYIFKLASKDNPRVLIPKEAEVWCEDTQQPRKIRLCRTESSPYVDEQNPNAKVDETEILVFEQKYSDGCILIRDGRNANYIKYLLAFDGWSGKEEVLKQNQSLKGLYELVDRDADVKKALKKEEDVLDAKYKIRKAEMSELRSFLRSTYQTQVDSMTDQEILHHAYTYADSNPSIFLDNFTDPIHAIRSKVIKAITDNIIILKQESINWADSGATIANYNPSTSKPEELLTQIILKGDKEGKDLQERIDRLVG